MGLSQEYLDQLKKLWNIEHDTIPKEYIIDFKELEKRIIYQHYSWLMKNYFIEWILS